MTPLEWILIGLLASQAVGSGLQRASSPAVRDVGHVLSAIGAFDLGKIKSVCKGAP